MSADVVATSEENGSSPASGAAFDPDKHPLVTWLEGLHASEPETERFAFEQAPLSSELRGRLRFEVEVAHDIDETERFAYVFSIIQAGNPTREGYRIAIPPFGFASVRYDFSTRVTCAAGFAFTHQLVSQDHRWYDLNPDGILWSLLLAYANFLRGSIVRMKPE